MKNVLILGASSGIARQFERLVCADSRLVLAGNDPDVMAKIATDLEVRSDGRRPSIFEFDSANIAGHAAFVQQVVAEVKHIDEVYLFFGVMFDEIECHRKPELAAKMGLVNYIGAMSILEHLANHMEANKAGLIVGVSSVAGDRGRASNYLYGSTRPGFRPIFRAARQAGGTRVHVCTIAGICRYAMTHLKKGGLHPAPKGGPRRRPGRPQAQEQPRPASGGWS